jgi:hypothetical protein
MLHHEDRFSEQEQKEIIGLAARLQRESGTHLTGDELTNIAAEVGIEPAYVREAIARLRRKPNEQKGSLSTTKALIALLLVAQWFALFSMFSHRLGLWGGLQWWLVF